MIVLFREVLVEKPGRIMALTNLNLTDLERILKNGGWNVVNLTKDRTVDFDNDNPGTYGAYDFNVLQNNDEVFNQVILFKLETSKVKADVS